MAGLIAGFILGNQVDLIVQGIGVLRSLLSNIAEDFGHAKGKTRRLLEAAEYADAYCKVFEPTTAALCHRLQEAHREPFTRQLNKLQDAVKNATALITELKAKPTYMWLARGSHYRGQICNASEEIDTSSQKLWRLLSTASTEIALQNNDALHQTQQLIVANANSTRPEIDVHDPEEKVDTSTLTDEEIAQASALAMPSFAADLAEKISQAQKRIEEASFELKRTNKKTETTRTLLANMRGRVQLHGDIEAVCERLVEDDLEKISSESKKALKLVDNYTTPKDRQDRVVPSDNLKCRAITTFSKSLRELGRLVEHLTRDHGDEKIRLAEQHESMNQALGVFDRESRTLLESLAGKAKTPANLQSSEKELEEHYVPLRDRLQNLVAAVFSVLEADRWVLLVCAHKLVDGLAKENSRLVVNTPSNEAPAEEKQEVESPRTARLPDAQTEGTNDESREVTYTTPVDIIHRSDSLSDLLERAQVRLAHFFEPDGDGFRHKPAAKVNQAATAVLLYDLEMLDVVIAAQRARATADLTSQTARNMFILTEMFQRMPRPVGREDSETILNTRQILQWVQDLHTMHMS